MGPFAVPLKCYCDILYRQSHIVKSNKIYCIS